MLLVAALESQRRSLAGDHALEVGDFFRIHAVIDRSEAFLGALYRGFGLIFVDLVFAKRTIGEHLHERLADFSKAGTDGQFAFDAVVAIPQDAGLQRGNQARVHRQYAHLTIRSGQIDEFNRCGKDLLFRRHDVEVEGHDGVKAEMRKN